MFNWNGSLLLELTALYISHWYTPESSFLACDMERILFWIKNTLSVNSIPLPLWNQRKAIVESLELKSQVRCTGSPSLNSDLVALMEGVVTGSVNKQWRGPSESRLPSEISASSQGPQNEDTRSHVWCKIWSLRKEQNLPLPRSPIVIPDSGYTCRFHTRRPLTPCVQKPWGGLVKSPTIRI